MWAIWGEASDCHGIWRIWLRMFMCYMLMLSLSGGCCGCIRGEKERKREREIERKRDREIERKREREKEEGRMDGCRWVKGGGGSADGRRGVRLLLVGGRG